MVSVRSPRERGKLRRKSSDKRIPLLDAKEDTPTKASKPKAKTIKKVRVWWPPTKNRNRSDVSGMFWPARMTAKIGSDKATVEYDNGDVENVLLANCQPANRPTDFGKEDKALRAGEFVEVFNNSKTDPASWFARIKEVRKTTCIVEYPFCDGPPETKKMELICRVRINKDEKWLYVDPEQKWKDGKFSSPMELTLIAQKQMDQWLKAAEEQGAAPPKKLAPKKKAGGEAGGSKPSKKRKKDKVQIPKSNPAKPARAKTAYLFFCDANRAHVKAKDPSLTMVQITTELGQMWKKATVEEREKFQKQAEKDKERHKKENEVYMKKMSQVAAAMPQIAPAGTVIPIGPGGVNAVNPMMLAAQQQHQAPMGGMPLITPTQLIDMGALKKHVKKIAGEDYFYQCIDLLRPGTPKFGVAATAAHQYIIGQKKPDVKGFLVTLFGLEALKNRAKR
mmetsp:Transcript_16396/g.33714  ORF Transcript_16396/g.33714 Transcript_16396/m.33714 type:complete len:449 (+) Transcript_16396:173-1519(+)